MGQDRLKPIRLDEREFKTDLGSGNFIFVGSSCDMWADAVPAEWILRVLDFCRQKPNNRYLFQSKNPGRFLNFRKNLPPESLLGVTIETNRQYPQMGLAPTTEVRAAEMAVISMAFTTMVTIEPIMDFDMKEFVQFVAVSDPSWVNIGADSKRHGLPEPPADKVLALIGELKELADVKIKKNLRRITG